MKTKLLSLALLLLFSFQAKKINAQGWSAVGTGLGDTIVGVPVTTLAVYNGELYAGGIFSTTASGIPVNNIARWNGTSWDSVGAGVNASVIAMTVYNGELYVGGNFTIAGGMPASRIVKWNGTNWGPLGIGVNSFVQSLAVHNGELYVGGNFTTAGGMPASKIAKWNGTNWAPVGAGLNQQVVSLASYNGELFAGGGFTSNFSFAVNGIAKWNGTVWDSVAAGVNGGGINALQVYDGELYAGGNFTAAGGMPVNKIARWNGITWNSVGLGVNYSSTLWRLTVYNGDLYADGFGFVGDNYVARWNGITWWSPVCTTMNYRPRGLAEYNGELYVVGEFSMVGNMVASHIARWSPLSASVTGNTLVCPGSPVTLVANTGNYAYQWYNNNVLLPAEINQQLFVTTTGNYSVLTSTNSGECTATSAPVQVTEGIGPTNVSITSSPTAGCLSNTIYVGYGAQSITLTASATGAVSYLWSTGATTQSISVAAAGAYSVTAYDANGCASAQTPETETIINVVDARCGNNKTKISLCHVPEGNPANRQTICIAPTAVAAHLALHAGDCIGACASTVREIISGNEENDVTFEPNPVVKELRIKNAEFRIESVEVYNVLAQKVFSLHNINTLQTTVDVSNLEAGIYFVTVRDENKNTVTRKIVKM